MTELDRARAIVRDVMPITHPDFACMLVASAVAGMRGLGMRHIRIGSLFWPDKFADADPYLSMRGGWGVAAYSEADRQFYLTDIEIDDDDGSFCGHTWLEPEPGEVLDLMHDNEGLREVLDADWKIVGRYIPRPPLERLVKKRWHAEMTKAIKLGRKHPVEIVL
jgi:hypothetical protein